jgi:hypothetical protein
MPPKGNTPALTPDQAERYARVLDLRRAGFTFDTIAREVGYAGRQGAKEAYDAAIKRMGREATDDLRVLENERLDDLWRRAYARMNSAESNDDFAKLQQTMIRISQRRSGLMGLDAPRQVEVTGEGGGALRTDVGDMLRERLRQLEQ